MLVSCMSIITYFYTYGEWQTSNLCSCLSYLSEESASVTLNCLLTPNVHGISLWSSCTGSVFKLRSGNFTTNPEEICRESCGLCLTSAPTIDVTTQPTIEPTSDAVDIPTVEPTECEDVAELSDVCRYSLTKCTCSEILELTTCDTPVTSTEIFSENMNACDITLLQSDIMEEASKIGGDMLVSCMSIITYFYTYGEWPTSELCSCLSYLSEESASVTLNCLLTPNVHGITLWSSCTGSVFKLRSRNFTTDPEEICRESCGLCLTSAPTIDITTQPTIEPTSDISPYQPTLGLTSKPTFEPAPRPTLGPTTKPTTVEPTLGPTIKPTVGPTFEPTPG